MDTAQALLISILLVLTVMLVVVGLQVFYILRELRKTLHTANKVLENTETITESIKNPVSSLSAILLGLKGTGSLSGFLKTLREKRKERQHE